MGKQHCVNQHTPHEQNLWCCELTRLMLFLILFIIVVLMLSALGVFGLLYGRVLVTAAAQCSTICSFIALVLALSYPLWHFSHLVGDCTSLSDSVVSSIK